MIIEVNFKGEEREFDSGHGLIDLADAIRLAEDLAESRTGSDIWVNKTLYQTRIYNSFTGEIELTEYPIEGLLDWGLLGEAQRHFNWGYHDGASDHKNGRRCKWARVHHYNVVYRQGYLAGFDASLAGEYDGDSTSAWVGQLAKGAF